MGAADYLKGMGDLFKSKRQRENERERRRRQAFRRAERAREEVNARLKKLEQQSRESWQEAKRLERSGEKAAARRKVVAYRGLELTVTKLDQKRFAFDQWLLALEMGKTDHDFIAALQLLDEVVRIDPEKTDDVLVALDLKRSEQGEVEKLWQQEYRRYMEGAEGALEDYVPSIANLEKRLEEEVAEEIKLGEGEKLTAEVGEKIAEGHKRTRELLEEPPQEDGR